jgi:lysophospholipase L1-like esterase
MVVALPLFPIMLYQGKKIRSSVPRLPEAKGTEGLVKASNNKTVKLIAIGESTMAGVGVDTHQEGFTGTLANELSKITGLNIDWQVYAKSGYTAERVNNKILPKIDNEKADLIVVGLSGNDTFTLNKPSRWRAHMKSIIENLQSMYPTASLVFINMPPIREFPAFTSLIKFVMGNLVDMLGQELEDLTKNYENVYYFGQKITLNEWIRNSEVEVGRADFFSDGVHPSKLTYQTWAKEIAIKISEQVDLQ